ncbi:MAG TPA: MarR family transcriptional regulator [Labilithrix sp.]|nr:MarR family transcriptional regulator [Labilithrix sp.]
MSLKDQLVLDEFLCFALYAASRSMTQLYRSYLDESDLTYPQFLVVFLLWKQDGQTVSAIAEMLLLDGGTVTPLLQRMETKGLIVRQRSFEDERVVRVFLTDAGKALETTLLPKIVGGMLCDLRMEPGEVAELAAKIHDVRRTVELAGQQRAEK